MGNGLTPLADEKVRAEMSLSDELAKQSKTKLKPCGTCDWFDTLDKSDQDAFCAHLARGGAIAQLYRAAVASGYSISESALLYHVRHGHVPE